jgi:hypothetical protein
MAAEMGVWKAAQKAFSWVEKMVGEMVATTADDWDTTMVGLSVVNWAAS